jgi:hypothetical protein
MQRKVFITCNVAVTGARTVGRVTAVTVSIHHGQSNAYQPTDSMSRLASRQRLAIVLKTFTVTCSNNVPVL